MSRDWVPVELYREPARPTRAPSRTEHGRIAMDIMPAHVRGVHREISRVAWRAIDAHSAPSEGGVVKVTLVDMSLAAGERLGAHVPIIGARAAVLTALFGPQRTGFRLQVDAGSVAVAGLRPGVRSILAAGDHLDLDPTTLAGAEWTITGDGEDTRIHVTVDNPTIAIQRRAGTAWQDVSATIALALTAPARLRPKPATEQGP